MPWVPGSSGRASYLTKKAKGRAQQTKAHRRAKTRR